MHKNQAQEQCSCKIPKFVFVQLENCSLKCSCVLAGCVRLQEQCSCKSSQVRLRCNLLLQGGLIRYKNTFVYLRCPPQNAPTRCKNMFVATCGFCKCELWRQGLTCPRIRDKVQTPISMEGKSSGVYTGTRHDQEFGIPIIRRGCTNSRFDQALEI